MLSREQVNWWRHYFHTVEDMPSNERGEAIELCDLALRSLSEPAAQVGETPRTVPVWIKSLVMQVNERVAEDATTRCTLDMENASNAVRDWQALERELAEMAAQSDVDKALLLDARKVISDGQERLLYLTKSAESADRRVSELEKENAELSINPDIAEYSKLRDEKMALEAKLAEKSKEVARWEKMYVCAQNSNSFRQDALDGK